MNGFKVFIGLSVFANSRYPRELVGELLFPPLSVVFFLRKALWSPNPLFGALIPDCMKR